MNVASRMESTSAEYRIHCSDAAAKLAREQDGHFKFFYRGRIQVKGKGMMRTFWCCEKYATQPGPVAGNLSQLGSSQKVPFYPPSSDDEITDDEIDLESVPGTRSTEAQLKGYLQKRYGDQLKKQFE